MRGSQKKNVIQPGKLANKEGETRFNWAVSDFSRLSEILHSNDGDVQVRLCGFYDQQKRCLLEAEIKADVTIACQTTFEPIVYNIDSKVTYCAVSTEAQFAEVEQEYEPVLVEDGLLDMKQVIEDELILSVPIAANKPANKIAQKMSFGELDEAAIADEKKAKNPFSVLSGLKTK